MTTTFKKLCPTHRFNYSGDKCPFCEQDRINNMVHKFHKNDIKKVSIKDKDINREVTENDIEKLKAKFNNK